MRHRLASLNLTRTIRSSSTCSAGLINPFTSKNPSLCHVDNRVPVQQQLGDSLQSLSLLLHRFRPSPKALIAQIQDSVAQIKSPEPRPLRISFYGSSRSRRSQVIDCLLLDTLGSSTSTSSQLLSRRRDHLDQEGSLLIEFDQEPQLSPGSLKIRHSWLKQHGFEIQEIQTDWDSTESLNTNLNLAPTGDLLVVVLDALSEHHLLLAGRPWSLLPRASIYQPILVVLTSPHPQIYAELLPSLDSLRSSLTLLHLDSSLALASLRALPNDSNAHSLVHQSGLNQLRDAILTALSPQPSVDWTTTPPIALLKTLSLYAHALSTATNLLLRLSERNALALDRLYEYQLKYEDLSRTAQQVLFPEPLQNASKERRSEVLDAVTKEIPFWKLPFISDQVALRVVKAVDEFELSPIEKDLIYQVGQMKIIKERSESLIKQIMRDPILKVYQSEISMNPILQELSKLQWLQPSQQGYNDHDAELIRLFKRRRDQLISLGGPVSIMQSKADHLIIKNLSASFGLSIFAYFSYLGSSNLPAQLESFGFCVDNYQAITVFTLVYLTWSSQAYWKKTSKKFAMDFSRWKDSLKFDLSVQKQRMIDQILLKQEPGCPEKHDVKLIIEIRERIKQSLKVIKPPVSAATIDQKKLHDHSDQIRPDDDDHIFPHNYNLIRDSGDDDINKDSLNLISLVNLFVKDLEIIHFQLKKLFIQR